MNTLAKTDFSDLTGSGLRHITYNGKDSLADFGILITTDTRTNDLTARSVQEVLPYKQGDTDLSRNAGTLYYNSRNLTYVFKVFADSREELTEKKSRITEWLNSSGDYVILDSAENGYRFVDCVLKSISVEPLERICGLYITALFSVQPFLYSPTGITTTLASAYGTLSAYIFDNKVVCSESEMYGDEDCVSGERIGEKRYRLTIKLPYRTPDGLVAFRDMSNNLTVQTKIVSAEGVTIYQDPYGNSQHCYCGYGTAVNGELTFTVTTEDDYIPPSYIGGAFVGRAQPYSVDGCDNYYIDAYTAGEPQITVNGEEVSLHKFTIPPDKPVSYVRAWSGQTGMYVLGYDSVEKRL